MDGGCIGRTGSGRILKTRRDRPRAEDEGDDRLAISRAGHPRRVRGTAFGSRLERCGTSKASSTLPIDRLVMCQGLKLGKAGVAGQNL